MYNYLAKLLIKILKEYDVSIDNHTIEKVICTHPEYPSMQCISDALDSWRVKHVVLKLTLEKLRILDVPVIAHLKEGEYVWLKKITDSKVYFEHASGKSKKEDLDLFKQKWSGVVLSIEDVTDAGDFNDKRNKTKKFKEKTLNYITIASCIVLFFILVCFSWINDNSLSLLSKLVLFFINAIGCYIAFILIQQENHQYSHITQKFCKIGKHVDCSQVTKSHYSKLFGLISWAELSIAYFSTVIIWVSISPLSENWLLPFCWFLILPLPFTIWSLFTQAFLIHKWCLFCCVIVSLLWINAGILSFFIPFNRAFLIPESLLILLLFSICIIAIIYANKVNKYQDLYSEQRETARIKYDFQTLHSQLLEPKYITNNAGFMWGNPQALYEVSIYVSIGCYHCSKAIKEFRRLTIIYPNFCYRLFFAINSNNIDDNSNRIINYLISLHKTKNKTEFLDILDIWFDMQENTFEALQNEFPYLFTQDDNKKEIDALCQFNQQSKINYTPAILLNGQLLSQLYSYKDLYGIIRTLNTK